MQIIVSTPDGVLYDDIVDYIVVRNQDGEFAILKNHIPIISIIKEGYVKVVRDKNEFYIYMFSGILEQANNKINVVAQEAHIGETKEIAKDLILQIRKERIEFNKRKSVDTTKLEKTLRENIKNTKAGEL